MRSRSRVDPVSLVAGGISRLALCAEAGNFSSYFAEAIGATVVEGEITKAEGDQSGPLLPPSISDTRSKRRGGGQEVLRLVPEAGRNYLSENRLLALAVAMLTRIFGQAGTSSAG